MQYITLALAAIAAIPSVSAHGHVQEVYVNGRATGQNGSPNWAYSSPRPQRAGWFANNQDNGFVEPNDSNNMACHKGATAGTTELTVNAGDTLTLEWNTWPESHHGPVIDYLARCNGACTSASANDLNFFKIAQSGHVSGSNPGTWASDQLISNGNSWDIRIPNNLSGNFVLRHEIIGLHSAGQANGAQMYPSCFNLNIVGSGTARPCDSGAACARGPALYRANDPGVQYNLYGAFNGYTIPGPALWSGAARAAKRFAKSFSA